MEKDFPPHHDLFAAQQVQLRERLRYFLDEIHPIVSVDVMQALAEPGKLFSTRVNKAGIPAGFWSLLTLSLVCALAPDLEALAACNVAVAVECFLCAVDLLDDVEDEDQTQVVQKLGVARTLNVSTVLLILAQRALTALAEEGMAPERVLRLFKALEDVSLVTAAGQHQDLLAEDRPMEAISYEECIQIVEKKSGALLSLPCRLAALCADVDEAVYTACVGLGTSSGIAHQLDNDCRDLYYLLYKNGDDPALSPDAEAGSGNGKTDLLRRKKTVPIVLAAHSLRSLPSMDGDEEAYRQAMHEGILATRGISLLYRERAYDYVQEIEKQYSVSPALRFLFGV